MTRDTVPDPSQEVQKLLSREGKDYLTVVQVRNGLSSEVLKSLGLSRKSPASEVLKKLKPFLRRDLQVYRSRSNFIGFAKSPEDIVLVQVRANPRQSAKQLASRSPLPKKDFLAALHALLASGAVRCSVRSSDYVALLEATETRGSEPAGKVERKEIRGASDDRAAFKAAYDTVGRGRSYVRIHRLRDHLGWSRDRFDRLLMDLRDDYVLQLHVGDPSTLSREEVEGSFMDEKGIFYITVTWRGKA